MIQFQIAIFVVSYLIAIFVESLKQIMPFWAYFEAFEALENQAIINGRFHTRNKLSKDAVEENKKCCLEIQLNRSTY